MKKKIIALLPFFVLLLIAAKVVFPFTHGGLLRTHDMEFHGARVANYFLALKQGQIPPRWAPNLYYAMGYPVFLFMYPLPYAASTVLFIAGLSIETSINVVVMLSIFSGVIGMYMLSFIQTRKRWVSILPAAAYVLAPYSLVNMVVRGAFGENVFFGLLPWVFVLIHLSRRMSSIIHLPIFTLVLAMLFLSHQLSVMFAIPIILGYLVLIFPSWKSMHELKTMLGCFLLSLLLVVWFWIPMIYEKKFTDVVNQSSVVEYWKEFPKVSELLVWSKWGYGGFTPGVENEGFSKMIGIHFVIALCGLSIVALKRRSLQQIFWVVLALGSLVLMLPFSRIIWQTVPVIQFLQFPWRFLWIVIFSTCFLMIEYFKNHSIQSKMSLIIVPLVVGISYAYIAWTHAAGTFTKTEFMWFEYPFSASAFEENLPIWILDHKKGVQDYLTFRNAKNTVPEVLNLSKDGTKARYLVKLNEETTIIHKTAYFPGWKAWIDGKETAIQYEDEEYRGFVVLYVPAGDHRIDIHWTNDTIDRKIADGISLAALMLYFLVFVVKPATGKLLSRIKKN